MTHAKQKRLLTSAQMAEILGVTKVTIYRMADFDPRFPHYRQGKTRRFDADEVLDYMGRNNRKNPLENNA